MKITSISKAVIAVGINALVLGGLVAGPASADPGAGVYGDLVGTGSDTTQDVMNGLSAALGENPATGNRYIASYDAAPAAPADGAPATGSASADCNTAADQITPQESGGPTFARPNGSGNGRDTLRAAIGQTASASVKTFACVVNGGSTVAGSSTTKTLTAVAIGGAVHYGRTSSGPSAGDTTPAGTIAYVPFAKDAVTVAVSPTSKIPALTFGTAAVNTDFGGVTGKVEPTLYAIYTCKATQVIVPATGQPFLADGDYVPVTGDVANPLKVYIPQTGSGTRSFWIAKFNVTEANITAVAANAGCLKAAIDGGPNNGTGVQEHNGLAVGTDDYAITPFSIPQFVAQTNQVPGVTSRINGAVLRAIGGVNPTTGTGQSLAMNPTFTTAAASSMLGRLMYNMVPSRELDNPESLTHEVFAGRDSLICSATSTIRTYGFAPLTATTGASSCGWTNLRVFAPSTASITIDVAAEATPTAAVVTAVQPDETVYFRVKNLVTVGDGGGVIEFSDGSGNVFSELYIDAGEANNPETATTASWLYSDPVTLDDTLPGGTYDVVATFIPNLPGVETKSVANLISFSLDARDIDGVELNLYANTYKVGKKGKIDVLVEGTGVTPTGTVTVKKGNSVLGTATLAEYNPGGAGGNIAQRGVGKATVNLKKFTKKGAVTLTIEYSGDNTFNPYSTTQRITVKK